MEGVKVKTFQRIKFCSFAHASPEFTVMWPSGGFHLEYRSIVLIESLAVRALKGKEVADIDIAHCIAFLAGRVRSTKNIVMNACLSFWFQFRFFGMT